MIRKSDAEDMHREIDWMKPSDRPILAGLADCGVWMTPKALSLNIPYTSNWIGQRLRVMVIVGLVERQDDEPGYRPTDMGQAFLAGELDADDLRMDADAFDDLSTE